MSPDLRTRILAACDAIEAHRDELGRLDAVAGDGDHGVSMAFGARAVRAQLEAHPDATGPALLALIASSAGSVGGAIGPLWATMLIRASSTARRLPEISTTDGIHSFRGSNDRTTPLAG